MVRSYISLAFGFDRVGPSGRRNKNANVVVGSEILKMEI